MKFTKKYNCLQSAAEALAIKDASQFTEEFGLPENCCDYTFDIRIQDLPKIENDDFTPCKVTIKLT